MSDVEHRLIRLENQVADLERRLARAEALLAAQAQGLVSLPPGTYA